MLSLRRALDYHNVDDETVSRQPFVAIQQINWQIIVLIDAVQYRDLGHLMAKL